MSVFGSPEYEAAKAKWVAERLADAPPLTEQQKVIIRTALLPAVRRVRGEAA